MRHDRRTQRQYRVHPVASLFPLLGGEAYETFKLSIRNEGQRERIVVQGNLLIDGRNRLRACLDLEIDPKVKQFGNEADSPTIASFIIAANIHRRHLPDELRRIIVAEANEWIAAESHMRQVEGGRKRRQETKASREKP